MTRDAPSSNPWLRIPASDYENHMGSENVGQLQVLSRIFKEALEKFRPRRLAVLGCATGNGFERIDPEVTRRIAAVDINPDYLRILEERFKHKLNGLESICSDLLECSFDRSSFDLIHGALIFEYVDPEKALSKIVEWLEPEGILSVALQLPSRESGAVTETRYKSLELLEPAMRLVDPEEFSRRVETFGLSLRHSREVDIKLGKKFYVAYYKIR
jgi:SAM-dependent methyltransferase